MKAKKCDCCGQFYDNYETTTKRGKWGVSGVCLGRVDVYDEWRYDDANILDLCPSCMNMVLTLLGVAVTDTTLTTEKSHDSNRQ